MSRALLLKLVAAKKDGADIRLVLTEILEDKCLADTRISTLAFSAWLAATLVFVAAVAGLVIGEGMQNFPILSLLTSMDDGHLQAAATACAIVSTVLFMTFLRLRQEHTKHTFLLILVMDGSIREAANLLFNGGRESRSGMAIEAADVVLGSII